MSLDVSALSQYVQTNADELLAKIVLGAPILSSGRIRIEKGVKDRRNINFFEDTEFYQLGNCVRTASGSTAFTNKFVEVSTFTNKTEDCLADFESKYMEVKLPAGSSYSEADYPQIVADNIVSKQVKHIGESAWRGKTGAIAGNNLSMQVPGWLYMAKNTSYSANTSKTTTYTGQTPTSTNAAFIFDDMVANLNEDINSAELDAWMPTVFFNALKLHCHTLYGYNFNASDPNEFAHPVYGNITCRRDPNMGNTKNAVITIPGNLIYVTDGLDEADTLEIKMDPIIKNLVHKTSIFKVGFDIAFADYVSIYTWN